MRRPALALLSLLALAAADGDAETPYSAAAALDALGATEASARCSACGLVATHMYDAISAKIAKGFKGWSQDFRVKQLGGAFSKACNRVGAVQVALMGEAGARKFADFEKMMQKGGSMSNLSMGPEQAKAVQNLCAAIVAHELESLVGRMVDWCGARGAKCRVLDYPLRKEVCTRMLNACEARAPPPVSAFDDDDDDDDDGGGDDKDEL